MQIGDISEKPPKIKHRFLRRSLILDEHNELVLKKVRMKGLHIKELNELERDEDDPVYDLNKHRYLKGKHTKCLRRADISSFKGLYWLNTLKNAKNLNIFIISIGKEDFDHISGFPDNNAVAKEVLRCFRKFPKFLEHIRLYIEGLDVKTGDVKQLYKTLAAFRKLKYYRRMLGFSKPENYVEHEYMLINKYLPRFKSLEDFEYDPWRYEKINWANGLLLEAGDRHDTDQRGFQKVIRKNIECPWINIMDITVSGEFLAGYLAINEVLESENSEYSESKEPDEGKKEDSWEDEEDEDDEEEEDEEIEQGINDGEEIRRWSRTFFICE